MRQIGVYPENLEQNLLAVLHEIRESEKNVVKSISWGEVDDISALHCNGSSMSLDPAKAACIIADPAQEGRLLLQLFNSLVR